MANKGCAARLALLLLVVAVALACECPEATVVSQEATPPPAPPPSTCCLNLSGSVLSGAPWPVPPNLMDLQVLDLSRCGLKGVAWLEGGAWLGGVASLRELHLQHNHLQELPQGLWGSGGAGGALPHLELLDLRGNRLQQLPAALLERQGLALHLHDNPWDCSCPWMGQVGSVARGNDSARLQGLLGALTCASPRGAEGRGLLALSLASACRPPDHTGLLLLLLVPPGALLLCLWWRRRARAGTGSCCHGNKRKAPPPAPAPPQNQLLLRPPSALLGSTRDLCEEVQVRTSTSPCPSPPPPPRIPREGQETGQGEGQGEGEGQGAEPDAVSVTDVMKDSTAREQAYLQQPSQFYSLVPGLRLDDWEGQDLS